MDRQMRSAAEQGRAYSARFAIGVAVVLGVWLLLRARPIGRPSRQRMAPHDAAGGTALTGSLSDEVDQMSQDSFPASDPPSFTPIVGIGTP
jgi:hypothetical protein